MNSIVIHGRLTRDPELRHTQTGTPVASFSVAVDRDYKPEGQEKQADFFDCVAWNKAGEFVSKYFTKGKEILVRGRMESRHWEDKDGNKRLSWELITDKTEFCGSKSDGRPGGTQPPEQHAPEAGQSFAELEDDDGDLPF